MSQDAVSLTKASYTRCLASPEFLTAFYQQFFADCPGARPLFAHTDFSRQTRLLQHAIGLLIAFTHQPAEGPQLLARLAEKHGPANLNIDSSWYPVFLESLIQTVRRHDPEFTPLLEAAWREVLSPGIAYMAGYR
jgi:hemoglobin-like flavoprotein